VSQTGQHAIIYGERGVGKTSLATVLYEVVSKAVLTKFNFAHVNCDVEDTFASLWRKIFRELPINDRGQVTTMQHPSLEVRRTLADWLVDTVSPDDIRRLSALIEGRLVVIIDEFDQLSGNLEAVRLIANTIKTLSDRRAAVTLILVGVADTVSQLVTEHESVERNLVQIHMPRMSDDEIGLIIREGLSSLGIAIQDENLAYVCSLAQGLPASAHRIGLQLAYRMIDVQRFEVTQEDIDIALGSVIDRMPQSHLEDV
jgi:Cdc6-like AAA superfamily ATPase